jgi:hypothetical protein
LVILRNQCIVKYQIGALTLDGIGGSGVSLCTSSSADDGGRPGSIGSFGRPVIHDALLLLLLAAAAAAMLLATTRGSVSLRTIGGGDVVASIACAPASADVDDVVIIAVRGVT